jgi:hypothetical protein
MRVRTTAFSSGRGADGFEVEGEVVRMMSLTAPAAGLRLDLV